MATFYQCCCRLMVITAVSTPAMSHPEINTDPLGSPVQLEELDTVRGLGGVVDITSAAHLEAILADNDASNSVTGSNSIDGGSFTDATGVFSIIQNTGNNVIIQDSTIITVTIHQEQ